MTICELCNTRIHGKHDKGCAFEEQKHIDLDSKQEKLYNKMFFKFSDNIKRIGKDVLMIFGIMYYGKK